MPDPSSAPYVPPVALAREPAAGGGELVLRTRPGAGRGGADVYELIVDGVFAMDSVEVSTELRLASETLRRLSGHGWRVVVGGLGLGFTLRELLADQRVASVDVIEIEPALVGWIRDDLVQPALGVLDDGRVQVTTGDIAAYLENLLPHSVDAILLDVDNGPDFLVHQSNSSLYRPTALSAGLDALRPGGVLALWCAARSSRLDAAASSVASEVEVLDLTVTRDGRTLDYYLYLLRPAPRRSR